MSLRRCMREHTERELRVWLCWLDIEEYETPPSRTDYYLAQVAASVARVLSRRPQDIKVEHFLLKFRAGPQKPVSPEQALAWSKAKWGMVVGLPPGALGGG
jgi:hypothetical protein